MIKLIEIKKDFYITLHSITQVSIATHEKKESQPIDFGMSAEPKKVGESFTIKIKTVDGEEYKLDKTHSESVYPILFP